MEAHAMIKINLQGIERQVSLIPLAVLNAALVSVGLFARDDKGLAVAAVVQAITVGSISLDQVKAASPSTVTPSALPLDVRKEIETISQRVTQTVTDTSNALDRIRSQERNTLTLISETHSKVDDLIAVTKKAQDDSLTAVEKKINARLNKLAPPEVDIKAIKASIASEVRSAFDGFRKTAPVATLEEIASALPPVTKTVRAGDIFDGCFYEVYGVVTDFSDLPVQVWGDPSAPALVDDYIFAPEHLHQTLIALHDDNHLPDNLWLAGERGTGKTEFVTQIAARLQRRLYRVNFDEALERADFIGGNTIEQGTVVWKAGVITQAIQHAGAIILLDEVGFARSQAIAVLHSLCERSPHRSLTVAETGQRIAVSPDVVFFCADNSNGHGDTSGNFDGVREKNSAFIDRFGYTLRFDYLPPHQEAALISGRTGLSAAAADIIIGFAQVARQKAQAGLLTQPPSLRQLFAFARAVKGGFPVRLAFVNAVVNKYPQDSEGELIGAFEATVDATAFADALSQ